MKILRYGPPGQEKPGLLDDDGHLRDLGALIDDITPRHLGPPALQALRAIDPRKLPRVEGHPRLGVPWSGVGKYIGVGLNYRDHAEEAGMPLPAQPILFPKWTSCLAGPHDDVRMPPGADQLDWEVELAIVIGSAARAVPVERALDHVAGYCVANDISERRWQIEGGGGQWGKGKGFDGFGPLGPYLVTADEVGDPQNLGLWLDVNGQRRQTGSTASMVFSCAELVSHCSRLMTLEPGDVIATGTPPGVGMGMKPPCFLRVGDVMDLGIDRLGSQRQRVLAAPTNLPA